jgi:hypothetical protein
MWAGASVEQVHEITDIDPWFLDQIALINEVGDLLVDSADLTPALLRLAKRHGFSDVQIAAARGVTEPVIRELRYGLGLHPVYKTVDTCAAEFAAKTPYHYSSYDEETEVEPRTTPAVLILGSGPNRIGQGIEFDYSCVHASLTLREAGYDTVMVNCNPETVSTDYDTSSRLYFEPLTLEDVLEELVGEIHSEHRRDQKTAFVERSDGSWLVDGGTGVEELAERFGIRLDGSPRDYSTISGLVLSRLERIPSEGDSTTWQGISIEVVDMDGRRIDKLLVRRL